MSLRSGWCLTNDHADCRYAPCTCDCHNDNEEK